jgi:glyoxylase I family protein
MRYNPFMFTGLEHTAIASPDPANLAQWYVATLGWVINFQYDGNFFVKAPNGAMLEIIPAEGVKADQAMRTPGLRHLAVSVTDFDEAYQRLRTLNVHFLTEPVENQGNRLVFFTDCDGNFLHLVQRRQPLP